MADEVRAPERAVVNAWQPHVLEAAHGLPRGGSLRIEGIDIEGLGTNDLELERFEVFAPDFKLVVNNTQVSPTVSNAYFRGTVAGMPDSVAVLSVPKSGQPRGLVQTPEGTWFIGDSRFPGQNVAGRRIPDRDFELLPPFQCGSDHLVTPDRLIEPVLASTGLRDAVTADMVPPLPSVGYTAKVAVETDYEFYQLFGNQTDAENYVGDLFAYASTIYEYEIGTNLLVSYLRIWTSNNDPWTASQTDNLLYQFKDYWNANMGGESRTTTHFLSGRPWGSGIAYVGALCATGWNYGLSTGLSGNFDISSPSVMWDIVVVAHEIGHNFGSQHTHCYNGTLGVSQDVDHCENYDSGNTGTDPYGDIYTCYGGSTESLPGVDSVTGGSTAYHPGTIMSYCHLRSGGFGNLTMTFGAKANPSYPSYDYHPFGVDAWRVPTLMYDFVRATATSNPSCLALIGAYEVTPSAGTGGTVSPSTPQSVLENGTASFTVTANAGYTRSSSVGGTCPAGSWNGSVYTTGAVTADCGVSFSFIANNPQIQLDKTTVTVPEGATATFRVRLTEQPASAVTVSVARFSGDSDITVQSGSSLSFTTSSWSNYQTVTLAAAQDGDMVDGVATIRASASGMTSKDVTATEDDDDKPRPIVTTNDASAMTETGANLNATVNPNGYSTTVYFDYGTSTSYGTSVTYGGIGSGTSDVPVSQAISGLSCGTTYHFRARADSSQGSTNGGDKTFATSACPGQLMNISTRGRVETGDNVMIGGFIIEGTVDKQVLIRARGPSLDPFGVPDTLNNPTLTLYSGQTALTTNDNWQDTQQSEIQATGFAPTNSLESAILITLSPGAYTAILQGVNNGTGIGIVEVFDIDGNSASKLKNISTRARVSTGDGVMIGGFVMNSTGPRRVLIRARGPSMDSAGVPNTLDDPTLTLYSGQTILATNDDWQDSQQAEIQATGMAPTDSRESAILVSLPSGPYTAIVRGFNNTTGIGIVEVIDVD